MTSILHKQLRVTDKTGLVHAVIDGNTFCGRLVAPAMRCWEPKKGDHFEICITCAAREISWFDEGNRYE
jgi:hypothetical protein